jgi:hypothetical protein
MMAEEQDDVTPEEKLLNVIQNGDEALPAPEEKLAEASAQPAAEVAPVVAEATPVAEAPAEEKPALKLAAKEEEPKKADAEIKPEAAADAAAPAEATPAEPAVATSAVVSSKKKGSDGAGIKVINRMLAAGILIMLGLSCFEVFSVIRARGMVKPPVKLELPPPQEVTVFVGNVQQAYAKDAFLRQKVGPDGGKQTKTTTITVSTTPWAEELKQFKLMGTSMKVPKADSEAILLDSRDNKMYFVRLGNAFPLLDGNVRLDDVEAGRARFTDGATSVELK